MTSAIHVDLGSAGVLEDHQEPEILLVEAREWWDSSFMEYAPDLIYNLPVEHTAILPTLCSPPASPVICTNSYSHNSSAGFSDHSYSPPVAVLSYIQNDKLHNKIVSFYYNKHKLINSVQNSITSFAGLIENPKYFLDHPGGQSGGFRITKYKYIEEAGDVYLTKLNLQQLASVLNLQNFKVSLTKKIEYQIMEVFNKYCINFQLGNKTVRMFSDLGRAIDLLYAFTSGKYPFTKHHLEIIVRRSLYREMQNNLRRKRKGRH